MTTNIITITNIIIMLLLLLIIGDRGMARLIDRRDTPTIRIAPSSTAGAALALVPFSFFLSSSRFLSFSVTPAPARPAAARSSVVMMVVGRRKIGVFRTSISVAISVSIIITTGGT
eukprot:CAMPEP_0202452488 /NCGR_PEP_ID=MMETSP1360-20130828/10695_1 /ASSEMBLY_ACC=CAM_ASM_000848 /TAXON_ID=515479 /ORGANISM="Licmophora paradoxa, Strain CCMP2313" /LENGTH=115 /DNA_ID=CAMNT_0049071327 /DNA_START=33 /DNA_END=377 /DNA_ORIENTATION=+